MASKKIQGITVEIGGDTTALSKALNDVNKEVNSTSKALKDVNRHLKLDPNNTVLLAEKQKLLKETIEKSKDAIKGLKDADKELEKEFKAGNITREEYEKGHVEIAKALVDMNHKLEESEEALKEAQKQASLFYQALDTVKAASDKVAEASGKIADGLDKAAAKVTPLSAGVIAIGTAGVKSISDLDTAVGGFLAETGHAVEATEQFADTLQEIYKNNYGEDYEDIASAMASIDKNLKYTGQSQLQALTEDAFALRDAFDYDVSESVRSAKALMDNFGIDGEAAFELIASGAQDNLDFSGELLDSISEYSVQFAKLGYSAEDMFEIFSRGSQNGAFNLDKVGDAFKELSVRVIDGSDTTKEAFEAIGLNANEMTAAFAAGGDAAKNATDTVIKALANTDDALVQNEAGIGLFGTMWEDLGADVILSMQGIEAGAYQTKGALDQIKDVQYDNLADQLQGLWRTVQTDILIQIMEQVMPMLDELVEFISGLVEKFSGLTDEQKQFTLAAAAIVAVLPLVLKALSGVFNGISLLGQGFSGLMTVMQTVATVITTVIKGASSAVVSIVRFVIANPITLLIAAIVALVVLIATKGDEIQAILQKIDDFLQGVFAKDWTEVFGPVIGTALNTFFANVKNVWDSVKKILDGIIDFIRGVFTGDWERAWNGVKEIFGGIFDGLAMLAKAPINAVIGLINTALSAINLLIRGINKIPGVNIPEIGEIAYLAKGGIMYDGAAVVGEAGPEILTMDHGRAIVQPLNSQPTTSYSNSIGGISIYVYGAAGQDVDQLADEVADRFETMMRQKEAVFT